mmetsp:Transcript_102163/g.284500  ORF Transcript_102163/g.284500 Transcript_102163/m.284500 type:complete len:244 (-) Transcript_102163:1059-1790(-)
MQVVFGLLTFFLELLMIKVLADHVSVLCLDLLLQLLNLEVHILELLPHLGNFLLRLQEVLSVQVFVSANCLIEVLLLTEFGLEIHDALFQLCHLAVPVLELFASMLVALLCHAELTLVLFPLPGELVDAVLLQVPLHLPALQVLPKGACLRFVPKHEFDLLLGALVSFDHRLVQDVSFVKQVDDRLAVNLRLFLQLLHVFRQGTDLPFELVPSSLQPLRLRIPGLLLLLEAFLLLLEPGLPTG